MTIDQANRNSCFGLNMLTTLPLEAFVCRSVMTTYYFPDEPFNMNRHLIFTTALVLTSMGMALVTCDLGAVFELIGATSASALAYIFPPLCYIKLSNSSRKAKIPAYLCIAFGITVMSVSLLQAIAKMIRSTYMTSIHQPDSRMRLLTTLLAQKMTEAQALVVPSQCKSLSI